INEYRILRQIIISIERQFVDKNYLFKNGSCLVKVFFVKGINTCILQIRHKESKSKFKFFSKLAYALSLCITFLVEFSCLEIIISSIDNSFDTCSLLILCSSQFSSNYIGFWPCFSSLISQCFIYPFLSSSKVTVINHSRCNPNFTLLRKG